MKERRASPSGQFRFDAIFRGAQSQFFEPSGLGNDGREIFETFVRSSPPQVEARVEEVAGGLWIGAQQPAGAFGRGLEDDGVDLVGLREIQSVAPGCPGDAISLESLPQL